MPVRTIAVANEKGGVGKTATVINLGAALSLMGKKILVIDMDPQANTTKGLGITSVEKSVYDLISDPAALPASDYIVTTAWENLFLIPSHIDLVGAEVELANLNGRENRLKDGLAGLDMEPDYIIIDTPPSLSLLTINVFSYASELIVPCQTHPYSFEALKDLLDTVEAIRNGINPALEIRGILPTFFDSRTKVSKRVLEKLKNHEVYGAFLLNTVIRMNTTIAESAEAGKPVVFYRKSSYGAFDYMDLAREIIQQTPGR